MELLNKAVCQENEVFTTREELETIFSGVDKDSAGQLNIKEVLATSKAANMVKQAENCATTKSSRQKRLRSFYPFVGLEDILEGPHFKGPKWGYPLPPFFFGKSLLLTLCLRYIFGSPKTFHFFPLQSFVKTLD